MSAPTGDLIDRIGIQTALTTYAHAVDTHDWDLLDEVFVPDADIDYREVVPYRGDLAYTKQWLSRMTKVGTYYHLLGLPHIVIDGDTAVSRVPCYNPMPLRGDPSGRRLVGHWYVDHWVRTPPGWRIRARSYSSCYQVNVVSADAAPGAGPSNALPAAEKLHIHELYARYNQMLDAADADGYAACFVSDGRLVRNGDVLDGRAALAGFAAGASTRGLKHFVANISVEGTVSGSTGGEAQGRADVLVLTRRDNTLALLTSGTYTDRLRCGPDGWQFLERAYTTAP